MSIADNLRHIQERIARAAESVGRRAEEVTLVGVTKYVDAHQALELAQAGCHHLGESRPQELWKKTASLTEQAEASSLTPIHWHLIGHLQRNKVTRTLPLITLIHSVDSERLVAAINAVVVADNTKPIDVLLEVNTSREAAKAGLAPDEVEPLLELLPKYPRVRVLGLMTIAALEGGPTAAAHNFATLRRLRDKLKKNNYPNTPLDELSMGMSDDFEVAIQEGATIVRIGSALWK